MVSKKLRKVMHRSLAVATSAVLIATASIGAGFTVSAEGEPEDVTVTVVSDPKSDDADEQESKVVGSVTATGNGIEVRNGGEVTANGDVHSDYGHGVVNEGGTVYVERNVDAGSEGATTEAHGIKSDGEGTVTVGGNVTGKTDGVHVENGGEVKVSGNVTGLNDDGVQIGNYYDIREDLIRTDDDSTVNVNKRSGTVTVGGDVTGKDYGLNIINGKVDVTGNVSGDVNAEYLSEVNIGGSVTADYGISAYDGTNVTVGGNVTAQYGVEAYGESNVTIDGDVTADVADDASAGATYGNGITSSRSNVTVGGNVTSRINGVEARYDSNVTVGGDVTADVFGINSRYSIISVEGSVKSNRMLGVESKGSNISIGKDVEGDLAGIMAGSYKKYKNMEREDGLVIGIIGSENLEYEMIPSEIRVGGNVTGGVIGLASDNSSTINVKGDVTASGKSIDNETIMLMNDGREFDPDDPISKIISTIPSASIGVIIGLDDDTDRPARALAIPADEVVDPEAGANPEEGNQKTEPVKGVVIVEGAAKAEDNGNGAYGVLVANLKNATAEEIIAETPDIVVYEFNLGENGQVVGYQDYSSMFNRDYDHDFDPPYPSVRTLAATSEDTLTEAAPIEAAPIEGEPSEDADELAAEVIDTVKGLINYIIKHDDEVTLDSLNDGEDVRVFGDGLETMRIGDVLNIKFQEGYELDNEDYLKTIASVEKISDGVYKITLNSELGGINIKALKKAIQEEIIDDPVVDPDEPDNKEDDPEEKPQENNDPVVVIIEESDPDPAPDSESDPEPASAPAPAVIPLVATTVAPAPAPAPAEPAVLGEKREAAVLGARKASTDDTTNLPIRAMIIIIASLGALIVCGTKYCVKER
jgi:hypothetical protein